MLGSGSMGLRKLAHKLGIALSLCITAKRHQTCPARRLRRSSAALEHSLACDAGQITQHFLALHKAKITGRFETAMKDKRHGSDNAYIKDDEQKLGRSSAF